MEKRVILSVDDKMNYYYLNMFMIYDLLKHGYGKYTV